MLYLLISYFIIKTQRLSYHPLRKTSFYLRVTLSKDETPMTAAAMAPRTTPPARTESKVFFKDGVMAASAANGLDIVVIKAAVAVTDSLDWKLDLQIKVIKILSKYLKPV